MVLQGRALYKSQRYSESIESYEKSIKYFVMEEKDQETLTKAIKIDPKKGDAWYYKGKAQNNLQRYSDAIESFNEAIKIDPENNETKSLLHDIYANANHVLDYDKALEISAPWAHSTVFEDKVEYIADNIKTKHYETARTYARNLEGQTPINANEKRCILHYLILCTYLLEGNFSKGIDELEKFRTYYSGMEDKDFKIGEEWSFRGLTKFINAENDVKPKNKRILSDVINILKGNDSQNQAWKSINQDLAESISNVKNKNKVIVRSVILGGIAIAVIMSGIFLLYPKSNPLDQCNLLPGQYTLGTGDQIYDILQNPTNPSQSFVAKYDSGNISVVDVKCQKLTQISTHVSGNPLYLAFDNKKLYVASSDSNNITIIDTNSETMKPRTYYVNHTPNDISVINSTIYIANKDYDSVSVYDNRDGKFEKMSDIKIGEPQTSLEADANKTLYVLHQNDKKEGKLSIIGVNGNKFEKKDVNVGMWPIDLKYDGKSDKIYVANLNSESVSIINPGNNYSVKNVTVGSEPRDVTVDTDTGDVLVVNQGSKSISVIDGKKDYVKNTLYIKESPLSLEYDEKKKLVYVTTDLSQNLYSLNLTLAKKNTEIQVGKKPWSMSQDIENHRLFVNNLRNNSVSVINTTNNTLKMNLPVGRTPSDIAYDPIGDQIFVANYDDSNVSIINGATLQYIATNSYR